MRRLRWLTSWAVATPILAYIAAALLVGFGVALVRAEQHAADSLRDVRAAATRRIDMLEAERRRLEHQLSVVERRRAAERAQLEDEIRTLTRQLRRLGVTPATQPVIVQGSSGGSAGGGSTDSRR